MGARHLVRIIKTYASLHVKTALEYRLNFFIQAGFMFINNLLYLFLFYLLFQSFGTIKGYTFVDVALIQAIAMLAIGLSHGCFGGVKYITEMVLEGKLDLFLSQPVATIPHIGISKSAQDAWGDVALGLIIIGVLVPESFVIAMVCAVLGAIAFSAIEIGINSLSFLLPRPKSIVRSLRYMSFGFSSWPIDLYPYSIRAVVYGLGLAFVATVPRNMVMNPGWNTMGLLFGGVCFMVLVATILFHAGLRRYESGNLVGMRG
jgi:ABC-2 type transport system permease protein